MALAGYVEAEQMPAHYAVADAVVLPSVRTPRGQEPWGLVVNEAMNQGVPVIATTAVGAAAGGLVQDGVTGYVVPERNVRALAEALTKVLDPEVHRVLSAKARAVIARWDTDAMAEGFRRAVADVTREARTRTARRPRVQDPPPRARETREGE